MRDKRVALAQAARNHVEAWNAWIADEEGSGESASFGALAESVRVLAQVLNERRGSPFKLTPDQVEEARRLYRPGEKPLALAERYGVHWRTMYRYLKERG